MKIKSKVSKVNTINPELTNMVLIYRAFNIEDLQRLRHQTAQVQPGQCVHFLTVCGSNIICSFNLLLSAQQISRTETWQKKINNMQLQNIVFIQNGAWEWIV